jgi:hypothetical protein
MCISSAPAEFSGTKGYIGEAQTKHGLVHVLVDHLLTCSVLTLDGTNAITNLGQVLVEENLKEFFPKFLVGQDYSLSGLMPNGDFIIQKATVDKGQADFKRVRP